MPKAAKAKEEVAASTLALGESEKQTENASVEEKGDEKSTEIKVDADGLVAIVSKKRAEKSVIGTTGDIVTFDKDGGAKVKKADAEHFLKVPDFELK
jgi:flavin-dependent dehydrogenase